MTPKPTDKRQEPLMAVSTSNESTTADFEDAAIRPFRIEVPQEEIDELRRRVRATRWPEMDTFGDRSQGTQIAELHPPVERLGTDYDWRTVEAMLNTLPQFVTEIDRLDIQFAHVGSPHDDAMPLLMTHGRSGSIIELLKVVDPLTNPTAHDASAEDAFHLVLPTMPGDGSSRDSTSNGLSPARMASAFHELMQRLGYTRYVSQGGDWGAIISELLAVQGPEGLLGIHVNMPGTVPPEIVRHLRNFDPLNAFDIPTLPVAVTVYPAEIYHAPRSWGEEAFGNLIYWNQVDEGGRFNAWEQPQLFSEEVRAAFSSLR